MPTFQIQFRRDTTENWENCNPVLAPGELGLEFAAGGVRLFKIGDGQTAWLDLPYCSGPKGDKFEFSDFTPEQIELLRGPKGESFKYEDFTPAQLAALIGPKGDDGNDGKAPVHEWNGTALKFQNPDGSWGQEVDLKGPKGDTTAATVPVASTTVAGVIIIGDNLEIDASGKAKAIVPSASDAKPSALGTASAGTSSAYARADHVHAKPSIPAVATATPSALGTAAVGTSTKYAREDHVHPKPTIPTASSTTPKANGTATVGTEDSFARGDHVHPADTSGVPVGTIVYFGKNNVPNGYLVCNGGSYSSTTYKGLYAVIGTAFGGNSTNFKVPNLIDKVAWGNATVGTTKNAGLPNITGFTKGTVIAGNVFQETNGAITSAIEGSISAYGRSIADGTVRGYGFEFNASNSNSIYGASTSVQPPALTLLPCIKY